MLYITNDDKPGFIGRLGTLLGESTVNIATFHLGRDKPGGSAIALVQVDQPISLELLGKIAAVEGVVQAKVLGF
jgi:D-3-phosphoglycerate dehydrogenase